MHLDRQAFEVGTERQLSMSCGLRGLSSVYLPDLYIYKTYSPSPNTSTKRAGIAECFRTYGLLEADHEDRPVSSDHGWLT